MLASLTWNDLSSILVEVIHSAQEDFDVSKRERQEDRAIIRDVAECLRPEQGVSIARLRLALRAIEGEEVSVGDDNLWPDEYDRLTRLYNAVQRQHGGVMQRVTRIERMLRDFEMIDQAEPLSGSTPEVHPGAEALLTDVDLEIVGIDKRLDELDNDRFVDFVFQLLLRRVRMLIRRGRDGFTGTDWLIILGADRIRLSSLESLTTFAEKEHVRLLLFFEHFRADAIDVVGGGGAAAAFFSLGNHREAKEASDFIGSQYKWEESQHSRSESESITNQWGTSDNFSLMFPTGSSRTDSTAILEGTETTTTDTRVREAIMNPEEIQGLPAMHLIYVEVKQNGKRVGATLDCDPAICARPRAATNPLAPKALKP